MFTVIWSIFNRDHHWCKEECWSLIIYFKKDTNDFLKFLWVIAQIFLKRYSTHQLPYHHNPHYLFAIYWPLLFHDLTQSQAGRLFPAVLNTTDQIYTWIFKMDQQGNTILKLNPFTLRENCTVVSVSSEIWGFILSVWELQYCIAITNPFLSAHFWLKLWLNGKH